MANPQVKRCPSVFGFLREKAAGEESKLAIERFIAYMSGMEDLALPTVDQLLMSWVNRSIIEPLSEYWYTHLHEDFITAFNELTGKKKKPKTVTEKI